MGKCAGILGAHSDLIRRQRGRVMRRLSTLAIAAAPMSGATNLARQAAAQGNTLFIQAQIKPRVGAPIRGARVAAGNNRSRRRTGGGGGGGGAAAAIGIAGAIMSGIIEAEDARAAAEQESAIALCARRYRSYDPQTQTFIGRGGRVYNCP